MATIEKRRLVIGFQPSPGDKSGDPLISPDATKIEVQIQTEWLEVLGWQRESPELNMVLDSKGIHITPAYPQTEEQ